MLTNLIGRIKPWPLIGGGQSPVWRDYLNWQFCLVQKLVETHGKWEMGWTIGVEWQLSWDVLHKDNAKSTLMEVRKCSFVEYVKQLSLKEKCHSFALCYTCSFSRHVVMWLPIYIEQERWIWPQFNIQYRKWMCNKDVKFLNECPHNNAIQFKSCVRNRPNLYWLNDWINHLTLGCSWGNYSF